MKRLLMAHGIHAETFTSGRIFIELVDSLPSFRPRCVILDMHMPGLDGLTVRAQLAALRPEVPVVFLSAAQGPGPYEKALACGAAGFFNKPFDGELERFIAALRAILDIE